MSTEAFPPDRAVLPEILSSLDDKARPTWTALLIIDMQNDFLDPNGKTASRAGRSLEFGRSVIPAMQSLLAAARGAHVLVVYVSLVSLLDGSSMSGPWLDARSRATYSVTDLCVEGSWGAEVLGEIAPKPGDFQITKYRYSGFAGTNLDAVLRSRQIRTVVCTGVSTNVCVEATAREAFSHEYYVVIPEDACASWDKELHHASLQTARHRYATVCSSSDLIGTWGHGATRS